MKKIINTLYEELKQSKWKTIIISLMIIVVFNDWFEFIIKSILIPKVFFYLKSAWYVDLIIGLFILILIPVKNFKRQTTSTTSVLAISSYLFLIIPKKLDSQNFCLFIELTGGLENKKWLKH